MEEIKFKPCPKCGREVDVLGGPESWIPTFYDPDSGDGGPYYIHCNCGLRFSAGYCELEDFAKAWNEYQSEAK